MLRVWVSAYLIFLAAPIVLTVLFSFHASASLAFPFQGFSLKWYAALAENPQFLRSLYNSVIVATATTAVTTILGSLAILGYPRIGPRWKAVLDTLTFGPVALPGLFIGISLLVAFGRAGISLSMTTVVIAHVVFCFPLFVLAGRSRIERFDLSLEEAARDLGAGPLKAFWLVTLPIIAPTLIGSAILVFALSFDEFIVTTFVIGTESTLPMFIWSLLRRIVNPTVNAASTLALAVSMTGVILAGAILRGRRRRSIEQRARNTNDARS